MPKRTVSSIVLAIVGILSLAACTPGSSVPNIGDIAGIINPENIPSFPTFDDLFSSNPITTSFDDVYPESTQLSALSVTNQGPIDINTMPRTNEGKYILSPGLYSLQAESFCLHAGTYGPSEGDGYLPAPLTGDSQPIIKKIISTYASNPAVTQRNAQTLIWAILARTKFTDMSGDIQATAAFLLTPEEIFEINGGALGLIPDFAWRELERQIPPELLQIYRAERELRSLLTEVNTGYEALEDIAVLAGAAPASDLIRPVPSGQWAEHPDGYLIRYFPEGYSDTRVEVLVPPQQSTVSQANASTQAQNPTPDTVTFDPTSTVATPANRSSQRLAIGMPELDTPPCEAVPLEVVRNSFSTKSFAYRLVTNCICQSTNLNDDVKLALSGFFRAAQNVTGDFDDLDFGESMFDVLRGEFPDFISNLGPSDGIVSESSRQIMSELSDFLYSENREVIRGLTESNSLTSSLDGRKLNSPLEWIAHQVQFEQAKAEEFLVANGNAQLIDEMNTVINRYGDIGGRGSVDWVQEYLDRDANYGNQADRTALGIAATFEGLGLTEDDFTNAMNSGLTSFPPINNIPGCSALATTLP